MATTALAALVACLALAAPAGATIVAERDAGVLARAIVNDQQQLIAGTPTFVQIVPPNEFSPDNPVGIGQTASAPFPRNGSTYGVLSSGDATQADNPQGDFSVDFAGTPSGPSRGDTAEDYTVFAIPLNVPAAVGNCLSVDFRFLSAEYPQFVGKDFNDAFIAELDATTWTTSGAEILGLENNFALDPTGEPVTIKSTGATSMSQAEAVGSPYGGATAPLRARTPVTPGAHTIYLSILDQSDPVLDTVVFLDNLQVTQQETCPRGSIGLGPAVTIGSPAVNSGTADTTPTLSGTAGDAAGEFGQPGDVDVGVWAGNTPVGPALETVRATRSGTAWSATLVNPLTDGIYTAQARQGTSTLGITGLSPGQTFRVDTVPPVVIIDTPLAGATVDVTTPTVSGRSGAGLGDSPGVTVTLYDGAAASGAPLQTLSDTSDFGFFAATAAPVYNGTYTAVATQTDDAGNLGTSQTRSFTVSVPGNDRPQQAVGGVAQQSPPPPPGDKDADGIPDDQDTSDGSLPPEPGKSVTVKVVSGEVFIKYPAGTATRAAAGFVPLKGAAHVPINSTVDTAAGRIALTSAATTAGAVQTSDFYAGIFQVKQSVPRRKRGAKAAALTTDLVLKGRSAATACGPTQGGARAAAKRPPKTVLGELWGNGKGRFRTRGKHSAATVRGTIWLTQDRCDGTLTRVTRGTVRVEDFGRRRTVTVKAGQSYLARAQRAAAKARKPKG